MPGVAAAHQRDALVILHAADDAERFERVRRDDRYILWRPTSRTGSIHTQPPASSFASKRIL
jgi:hypothetical protein